jgi:hypothetical protein
VTILILIIDLNLKPVQKHRVIPFALGLFALLTVSGFPFSSRRCAVWRHVQGFGAHQPDEESSEGRSPYHSLSVGVLAPNEPDNKEKMSEFFVILFSTLIGMYLHDLLRRFPDVLSGT